MLGLLKLEYSKVGLLILKYWTLLSYHRIIHKRDLKTGKKLVTCIKQTCAISPFDKWLREDLDLFCERRVASM